QSEAPLIIRPYLQQLTKSEIHAVMTGGFATIAGSVLGAYIQAGVICSYIFMPFSFMMGVDWNDSFLVGELIGYKTFFNEFLAYNKLAEMIKKRQAGGPEYSGEIKQYLSAQSEVIATYALCGFANFGSLGVQIGALSSLAPKRRSDISSCALRSLISGTIACFMTACVAGNYACPTFG
ncbi:S28A3 protein, partial [Polypterus senegalus]|nr:S28A3 protein [Polypterus senegalus]